jgi:hypothetical protein
MAFSIAAEREPSFDELAAPAASTMRGAAFAPFFFAGAFAILNPP